MLVNNNTLNSTILNGASEDGSSTWPGGNVIIIRQAVGVKSTRTEAIVIRQIVALRSVSTDSNAIIIRQNVARRSHLTNAITLRQRVTDA